MSFIFDNNELNQGVVNAQYAVRGRIAIEAGELAKKVKTPNHGLPFDEVYFCNIGNPAALGQQPITFYRQLLALVNDPNLLENSPYPEDVTARAREILADIPRTAAYTHSKGHAALREYVGDFIENRDSLPKGEVNRDHIFFTDGASPAIQSLLQTIIRGPQDGILTPIPQYPLYSASIALNGGSLVPYYLIEEDGWGIGDLTPLSNALKYAKDNNINPRAMVVINPGNPTGQVLTRQAQLEIIKFCVDNDILLLADEVYQMNIYQGEWTSFRQVLFESEYRDQCRLASFHSTSKGYFGECGRRGGYGEYINFPEEFLSLIYKLSSVRLCPNIDGQIAVACMCSLPKPGDTSYESCNTEITALSESYKRRAARLTEFWNSLPGVTCQTVQGSMYSFPKITMPQGAIVAAEKEGVAPDMLYALELLHSTGVCAVPGSGFKQVEGTYHLRCTILPAEEKFDVFLGNIRNFHATFLAKYE
ncbi:hypothetical protein PCE1_000750 [Barthelona sp. PCE]